MTQQYDRLTGPWISYDAIPPVLREFQMNRDPYIRAQLLDLEKTEKQRRDEQAGRGSNMVTQDKAELALKPPQDIRNPIDKRDFQKRWLLEQRDAVLAQSRINQSRGEHSHERLPLIRERSR